MVETPHGRKDGARSRTTAIDPAASPLCSRHFTALYSNTARAHELKRERDWVVA